MAYTVIIKPAAERELRRLGPEIQLRLQPHIADLARAPRPPGYKKLVGLGGLYRIRVGDYRVVYEVRDEVLLVLVVKIGHRSRIYG